MAWNDNIGYLFYGVGQHDKIEKIKTFKEFKKFVRDEKIYNNPEGVRITERDIKITWKIILLNRRVIKNQIEDCEDEKMGINFLKTIEGKVGDIIYPAHNETNGFWQKPRWELVIKVDKDGYILERRYIWDFATVKAIELIQEFPEILRGKKK